MDENLPPIREPLDPGIKLAVELLRAKGLATVDSGDGYSKEEALEAGEALPYGHVYIQVDKPEKVQEVIATATIIFWPYYGYQMPTVELLARPECHTAVNEPDIVAVHWPVGGLRRADTGISPFDAAGVQPTQKGGAPAELTPLEVRRLAVRDLLKSVGCRLGYSDPDAEVWWTQKGEVRRIPTNGSRLSVSNQMDMLAAVERVLGIQPDVQAAPPGKLPELGFPQIQVQTSGASLADLEAAAVGVTGTAPEAAADGSPDFLDEVVAASGPGFAEKVEAAQARRGANLCGGTGQIYDPLARDGFSGDCKGCDGCKGEEPTGDAADGAKGGCKGCDESCEAWARCGAQTDPTDHAATIAALQEKLSKAIEERDEARAERQAMAKMGLEQVANAGSIADQLVAARVAIADLEQKLRISVEERVAERNFTLAAHREIYAIQERTMDLLYVMGIGHSPMNLYERVLTLLPKKRVTQWLSMKLAEARLNVERARFENSDADDSLDVIKGAIMVEAEAHRRLRSYLGGPPPAPSTKVL